MKTKPTPIKVLIVFKIRRLQHLMEYLEDARSTIANFILTSNLHGQYW